jgi:hypothetical protein
VSRGEREREGRRKDDIGESPALQQNTGSDEKECTRRQCGWESAWRRSERAGRSDSTREEKEKNQSREREER